MAQGSEGGRPGDSRAFHAGDEADYSGRFLLRVPRRLHAELARDAKRQGVSLNQYVLYLLAQRSASKRAA